MADSEAELMKAIAEVAKAKHDSKIIGSVHDIREMRKKFKITCDTTKREVQRLDQLQKKPTGKLRSDRKPRPERAVYSDGKWVNKGIDDASEPYDEEEKAFINRNISRIRRITDLKSEHIKYLVMDVFLKELKDIKSGRIQSDFHDRYHTNDKLDQKELQSEIRTSLFTNEQRDYICGLLQGAFQTTLKDGNDDIKHSEIKYVGIVMVYECIARIVQKVHDLDTVQQALVYMRKRSREASGVNEDDDD